MIDPLWPAGLKLFPNTPKPDHVPVMPLCVVGKATGLSDSHMEAGIPEIAGVTRVLTLIDVVFGIAHCPAAGVNVKVMDPLKPDGLKLFPVTPIPDQVPVKPLCVVDNAMAALFSQIEAGIPDMAGVTAAVTSIEVVLTLAH